MNAETKMRKSDNVSSLLGNLNAELEREHDNTSSLDYTTVLCCNNHKTVTVFFHHCAAD